MSYVGYAAYPKVLYHETEGARRVEDQNEHDALGDGWQDTPFGEPETTDSAPVDKPKRGRKSKKADDSDAGNEDGQ